MDLSSSHHFKGWDIRYALLSSSPQTTASTTPTTPVQKVVFVHGTPWSSIVYRPIIQTLLSKPFCQILIYDLPGYGQSQTYTPDDNSSTSTSKNDFPGDTSVAFQASALASLLQHVAWDSSHPSSNASPAAIAHDIAGTIVLRAHLLHAIEFSSMMLMDANAVLPWGDGFYQLCRAQASTFLQLPAGIYEAVVRAVVQSALFNPLVLEAGWGDELARPWLGSEDRQRSFVRQVAQADDADVREMLERDMYASVRCDVKVLTGGDDQWIPREKVEDLVRRLGDRAKEFVVVPEAGHLVMLDQPARVAVEIYDWLRRRADLQRKN